MNNLNIYEKAILAEHMAKYDSKDWYYVKDMDKYYELYAQTFAGNLILLKHHTKIFFQFLKESAKISI